MDKPPASHKSPAPEAAPAVTPGVKARFSINLVENARGELLLLKRSRMQKLGPGMWGFPAGHIEGDETPEDCSLRELREEIGQDFQLALIRRVGPIPDIHYGGIYRIYLFHYRWMHGKVKLNHEHTAWTWVGREDYRDYPVMDGMDEDILHLNIWPREFLHHA